MNEVYSHITLKVALRQVSHEECVVVVFSLSFDVKAKLKRNGKITPSHSGPKSVAEGT